MQTNTSDRRRTRSNGTSRIVNINDHGINSHDTHLRLLAFRAIVEAINKRNVYKKQANEALFMTSSDKPCTQHDWRIDSGASSHIPPHRDDYMSYKQLPTAISETITD